MEFFNLHNFWEFVFLFLPGFISVKTYHSIVASDKYDFSKDLLELVGYSLLNLIINSWLILINIKYDWIFNLNIYLILSGVWILIISPILWPLLIRYLMSSRLARKYLLDNKKSAWDFYFNQRKGSWIIVNLKNGERIGGNYSENSYATSYPCKESIYLEELWELGENADKRKFKSKLHRTGGILILSDSIESIEFYN